MRGAVLVTTGLALLLAGCDMIEGDNVKGDTRADCLATPAAGGPDDVTGIRLGMDLGAVKTLLACRDGGFRFDENSGGFPIPALPDGKRPITKLTARRGKISGCDPADSRTLQICMAEDPRFDHVDELVYVYFAGMPGAEKAIAVMREISFPEGGKQAGALIERELAAKYGQQPDRSNWGANLRFAWMLDGRGQRRSPVDPDFALCREAAGFGRDAPYHLRPGCRRTITAWITTAYQAPEQADGYGVALVDQDAGIKAIEETTARIGAISEKQRQQEQQRASVRSGGVSL